MGGVSKSLVNVSHLRVWGFNWDRGIKLEALVLIFEGFFK